MDIWKMLTSQYAEPRRARASAAGANQLARRGGGWLLAIGPPLGQARCVAGSTPYVTPGRANGRPITARSLQSSQGRLRGDLERPPNGLEICGAPCGEPPGQPRLVIAPK